MATPGQREPVYNSAKERQLALAKQDPIFSVSSFASMADSQYHNLFSIVMIEGYISSLTELNYPLTELRRQLFSRATNLWMLTESFYALPNRFDSTLRCIPAFGS
jgi:hypothetical protein